MQMREIVPAHVLDMAPNYDQKLFWALCIISQSISLRGRLVVNEDIWGGVRIFFLCSDNDYKYV